MNCILKFKCLVMCGLVFVSVSIFVSVCTYSAYSQKDINVSKFSLLWENSEGHSSATLWCVRVSPSNTFISATFFDNTTVILDFKSGKIIKKFESHKLLCEGYTPHPEHPNLRCSAWSSEGKYLAVSGDDRIIRVYNTSTWELVRILSGHKGSVLTIEFSPDGNLLASGSGTDKVLPSGIGENITKIWDVRTWDCIAELKGHKDGIINLRWSPDGSMLATASDDRTIKIWNRSTWHETKTLTGHKSGVLDVAWSPNGTRLVSGSRDYKIMLWDIKSGKYIAKWSEENCIRSVDWHPSGKYILTSGVKEVTLKIRNATTGNILKILSESLQTDSTVLSSRWSHGGEYIVAGTGKDHTVRLYGIKEVPVKHEIPKWVKGVVMFSIASSIAIFTITYTLAKMFKIRRQ